MGCICHASPRRPAAVLAWQDCGIRTSQCLRLFNATPVAIDLQAGSAGYREPNRPRGRVLMTALIETVSVGVAAALTDVITMGRTFKKRAADTSAYFDRPGTSNEPTEAVKGRLDTCVAPPSAPATSPTASPDPCSRPLVSDHPYTLDCDSHCRSTIHHRMMPR